MKLQIKQKVDEPTINMMRRWVSMWARCYVPSDQAYEYYGARGISVCQEWMDYINFRRWACANNYGLGLTIDRINNDGNYEPGNCQWVTHQKNCTNKHRTPNTNIYFNEGKYRVTIKRNYKSIHIGYFNSIEEARIARDNFIQKYEKL